MSFDNGLGMLIIDTIILVPISNRKLLQRSELFIELPFHTLASVKSIAKEAFAPLFTSSQTVQELQTGRVFHI